jgi:23S rRNA (adenine2503-C2)-methyltransferase
MKTDLKGLGAHEIEQWAMGQGLDAYRGRQIRHWLFKKLAKSFEEMTTLPKDLRASKGLHRSFREERNPRIQRRDQEIPF